MLTATMVFDDYTKQRILFFFFQGSRALTIARLLETEGIVVSGRKMKITDDIKCIVDEQMSLDNETTATQLHVFLTGLGYDVSLRTILHYRHNTGSEGRKAHPKMAYWWVADCELVRVVGW